MTKDKIRTIVNTYKKYLTPYIDSDTKEGHCYWMLTQIGDILEEGKIEKAMRWVGFIQGFLWTKNYFSIEELKTHNR
jgi:hypothetical protein